MYLWYDDRNKRKGGEGFELDLCEGMCLTQAPDIGNLFFVSSTGTQEKACWSTGLRCTVGKEGFDMGGWEDV